MGDVDLEKQMCHFQEKGIAKNHVAEHWREQDALEFQDGSRNKLKPGKSTNIGNDPFLNQKQNQ